MQHIQTLLEELDQLYRLGKVQMNVTVSQLGNQSQWWLQISIGLRRRNRPLWGRIAQSPQPIVIVLRHATAHQGTLSLIETALSDAMIVPDGQQRHHPARQSPVDRQVRAQHTMPILDGTTGTHGRIPGCQQRGCDWVPLGWHPFQQRFTARAQDGSSLPGPAEQTHSVWPQRLTGLLLQSIQCWRKEHQMGQCCLQQGQQAHQLVLHRLRRHLTEFGEQSHQGFQFYLPHTTWHEPLSGQYHTQQVAQLPRQVAQALTEILRLSQVGGMSAHIAFRVLPTRPPSVPPVAPP